MTDEELWAAYVGGDDAALEPLVDRHCGALFWYLLLSTGRQKPAAQHAFSTWDLVARWRRPHDGFESFKGWLYAVATQNAVPAGHPEGMGLTELMEDVSRSEPTGRWGETFFRIADMHRHVRQPFLLVTVAGLSIVEAARACNFSEEMTARCVETAYRRLARTRLFKSLKTASENPQ
jgi:DNA-directed RNA polymerase specialized sigma24 family protein